MPGQAARFIMDCNQSRSVALSAGRQRVHVGPIPGAPHHPSGEAGNVISNSVCQADGHPAGRSAPAITPCAARFRSRLISLATAQYAVMGGSKRRAPADVSIHALRRAARSHAMSWRSCAARWSELSKQTDVRYAAARLW